MCKDDDTTAVDLREEIMMHVASRASDHDGAIKMGKEPAITVTTPSSDVAVPSWEAKISFSRSCNSSY